jgi:SAM-dependent methyltransferase
MNIECIAGFDRHSFDVVFSSNTLEHVRGIGAFLDTVCQILKPDGVVIIAVPPVTSDLLRDLNLANPYHVNIWTPDQWFHVLLHYFESVDIFSHGFDSAGCVPDWHNLGDEEDVSEARFVFAPIPLEAFKYCATAQSAPSITAVFVARRPRPSAEFPDVSVPLPFTDHSFTRSSAEVAFQMRVQQQLNEIATLHHFQVQYNQELEDALQQERTRASALITAIEQKNQHIHSLEALIKQLESGRVMRLLRWLHYLRPSRRRKDQAG